MPRSYDEIKSLGYAQSLLGKWKIAIKGIHPVTNFRQLSVIVVILKRFMDKVCHLLRISYLHAS